MNLMLLAGLVGFVLLFGVVSNTLAQAAYAVDTSDMATKKVMAKKKAPLTLKKLKVALVTDASFQDAGWGSTAFKSGQALKTKYKAELGLAEKVAVPDIEATLRDFASRNYDLIIAHGFEWGDPAVRVAKDFPKTKFVVFTGLTNAPNVASIFPMQQEGTFLLGALAGMMTKSNVIGFVGGQDYPNLINIYEGYKQGALAVNPKVKVLLSWTGDWNDPAKGREAARAQINQGADILFHTADTSGQGVIKAAEEKGIFAFGAVADQNGLSPNTVLTSFVLDIPKAFDMAYKMTAQGKFNGELMKPGLETKANGPGSGIVYMASFHGLDSKVPQAVKDRLKQLTDDIISGKIKVPERHEYTT